MTVDGRSLANFVLDFADMKGWAITHLDLQKLVYFCHADFLVQTGKPLVKESFEAWQFGPVLKYLYNEFKSCGDRPITTRAQKMNRFTGASEAAASNLPKDKEFSVAQSLEFYMRLPTGQLVELSHARGGPWWRVWNHESLINPGMRIDHDDILRYHSIPSHHVPHGKGSSWLNN